MNKPGTNPEITQLNYTPTYFSFLPFFYEFFLYFFFNLYLSLSLFLFNCKLDERTFEGNELSLKEKRKKESHAQENYIPRFRSPFDPL